MGLIKPDQRIELVKLNQGMGLIISNQDIQLCRISRSSIIANGKTLNRDKQDIQSC